MNFDLRDIFNFKKRAIYISCHTYQTYSYVKFRNDLTNYSVKKKNSKYH